MSQLPVSQLPANQLVAQRGKEHYLKSPLSYTLQYSICRFQSKPPLLCNISWVCGLHLSWGLPPTLGKIMWAVKIFTKFSFLHSWRDLQGFKGIPATNLPLDYSWIIQVSPSRTHLLSRVHLFDPKNKDNVDLIMAPPLMHWSACNYYTTP